MERRVLSWMRAHKGLLAAGAAVLLCLLLAAWSVYEAPIEQGSLYAYTKYNDEYSTLLPTEAAPWEVTQTVSLAPGQRVYGLRLLFDTARVSNQGTLTVTVETPEGQPLAALGTLNAAALLDGDFQGFPFAGGHGFLQDNPHINGSDCPEVVLRLVYQPAPDWAEPLPLSLWCSEGAVSGLLTLNGQPVEGTLALQLMTENAEGWARKAALAVFLPLAAAILACALLALRRVRLPLLFGVVAGLLGMAFLVVTPVKVAPDEYAHIAGCYSAVSRMSGLPGDYWEEQPDGTGLNLLPVRECDAPYLNGTIGTIGPAAYKGLLVNLNQFGQSAALTHTTQVRVTDMSLWYLYLPQLAGIWLGRALGLGFYGMVLLARGLNLLGYLALMALAIHWMPGRGKGILLAVGLLPMSLQLGASLSPDAATLGLCCCLAALCLHCRSLGAVSRRHWGTLLVLAFLVGPAKTIYLPMVALAALVSPAAFGKGAAGWAKLAAVPVCGLLGASVFSNGYLEYVLRDMDAVYGWFVVYGAAAAFHLGLFYYLVVVEHPRLKIWFWRLVGYSCAACVPLAVLLFSRGRYQLTPEEIAAGILPNGDSKYYFTLGYVFHNLGQTAKLLLNSVLKSSAGWLQGMLGTALGEPIVYPTIQVNWLLGIGLLAVLALAALRTGQEQPRLARWQRWLVLGVSAAVLGICFMACLTWTPINYTVLFGVQGRYFLPVLPLLLLLFGENTLVRLEKDCTYGLTVAQTTLVVLVLCQAFLLYCQGA